MTVEWNAPQRGEYDKFLVSRGQGSTSDVTKSDGKTVYEKSFTGLSAGTEFTVSVITVSYDQQSSQLSGGFYTGKLSPF